MHNPLNIIVLQDCLHPMCGNFLQTFICHPSEDKLLSINHKSEVYLLETLSVLIKCLHPLYTKNDFHVSEVHYEKVLHHCVIRHCDAQQRNKACAGQESPFDYLNLKTYMCFHRETSLLYQG